MDLADGPFQEQTGSNRRPMPHANLFKIGNGWFPERKGGAENVFYNLFSGLAAANFTVRGLVPSLGRAEQDTEGRLSGFAGGRSSLHRAIEIRRLARASFRVTPPDLVASHFALHTIPILDQLSRRPLVVHFHGPWAMESAAEGAGMAAVRAKKAIESLVYRRAQRIIVLSQAFGDILQKDYGVPSSVLSLVPGGVDCDRFSSAPTRAKAREKLGWDPDRPALFTARRLVRRMGLNRLLEAMSILRRSKVAGSRDVVLHIAGSGPEHKALEAQAEALGLSDVVRFDGFMPDDQLPLAYRAADMTLMPSAELEGFGLVAIESLAAGTPVLATPVGGLPEVVSGLSERMLLGGTDARSIADGIAAALEDTSFLPNGEACSRYARDHFDWRVIVPKVAQIYREVL
jgi:glycosyltransferase involved in cell wall biosynthesis